MTRLVLVRQHTRAIPSKLGSPIHRQLREEVETMRESDALSALLAEAIEAAMQDIESEDPAQAQRIAETW